MIDDLANFARYAWGLKGYLSDILTPERCRRMLIDGLENRDKSFLSILERGIYATSRSPYRKLLLHAGVEFGDAVRLVHQLGIEGTLAKLYDEGVYVTLDEFKGRRPILRKGLEFQARPQDFNNPLLTKYFEARSSGSRGVGTRIAIDLDLLTHEAAHYHYILTSFDLTARPIGLWRAVPPAHAGMKVVLRYAKLGKSVEKWFGQSKLSWSPRELKYALLTNYTIYTGRFFGRWLPLPEYVPIDKASEVAYWLAKKKEAGTPAVLDTNASSGVRTCIAAKEKGLDISGTFFRFGGEPFTTAKARVVTETGSHAICHYSMAEIGHIGIACAAPSDLDDVHLLTDKVAVIQRPKTLGSDGLRVESLVYTTILPSCPKMMLNLESGDYGVIEERVCGCPIGGFGFTKHLSLIRSYEKVTSEGVTFLGTELLRLLDEVLPARFGGHPTDYQLVEEEEGGLPKVNLFVSPRVGNVSEKAVLDTVFQTFELHPRGHMIVDQWRPGQTIKVIRGEPYTTTSAKILPLHILQKRR
jgi:hypothetical protein